MSGPYETQRQAADAARHIIDSRVESWTDGNHRLTEDACPAAGVQLGACEHRILVWLAGWELATCAVIAGLITRAHRAGKASTANNVSIHPGQLTTVLRTLADATGHRTGQAGARCEDCLAHPAGLCDSHTSDLDQAEAYRALERRLIDKAGEQRRAGGAP